MANNVDPDQTASSGGLERILPPLAQWHWDTFLRFKVRSAIRSAER